VLSTDDVDELQVVDGNLYDSTNKTDLTTSLYGFTDTSGLDGTLNGTPAVIATAPSGDVFKGLAWAPVAPGTGTPETPWAIALPVIGAVLLGGAFVVRRRRDPVVAQLP
jgi:hypothetical protein